MRKILLSVALILCGFVSQGQICSAQFNWAPSGSAPLGITFTNTSPFTPTGSLKAVYYINFMDPGNWMDPFPGTTISHNYSAPGTYYVGMDMQVIDTLTQQLICQDSTTQTVVVTVPSCYSSIVAMPNGGGSYTFAAANIGGGSGLSYSWDFDDGTASVTGSPVTHVYTSPGYYTVTLDAAGGGMVCTSDTQISYISGPPNEISGSISWDSTIGVNQSSFKVWLVYLDTATNMISAVDSATVSGAYWGTPYSFSNVPPAEYRVKAAVLAGAPGVTVMAPTYHTGSLNWSTASLINHVNYSPNKDIMMQAGSSATGPGFIAGNVTQGAGKGTTPGVPNLLILLRDQANQMVRFTYTNANGDYSFANIPAGNFNVYPENMPQVTTPSSMISLVSGSYSVSGVDFVKNSIEIKPVNLGIQDAATAPLFRLNPNPAHGAVHVSWKSTFRGDGHVFVTDITGRPIYDAAAFSGQGLTLPLEQVPAGVYFIRVSAEGAQHTEKLIVQ